jgi:GDP-fucose transporter C1
MYYGNLMSAVFIVPFVVWNGEAGPLTTLWKVGGHDLRVFAIGTCITGFFGFLLGVANLLSIKVTSPVTHMFSSVSY